MGPNAELLMEERRSATAHLTNLLAIQRLNVSKKNVYKFYFIQTFLLLSKKNSVILC